MTPAYPSNPAHLSAPARRERDLRLDFFRGLAMFIILVAHTPGNYWGGWIPARFGFSDATEIFVFCSGMASGIAFGSVFLKRSWFLGAARILFRVWQVYWAHIGVVLTTALLVAVIDVTGFGASDKVYTDWFPVAGLFDNTANSLIGLFTLTYIPGLFDILPMYLVILAMVPVVMAIHRFGGRRAVLIVVVTVWLAANLAGYARAMAGQQDLNAVQAGAVWLGNHLIWMNLPGMLWSSNPDLAANATWYFNPFGWQLVFFTGFAFTLGWLPPPPVRRWLVLTAFAVVLVTMPFAWDKLYAYLTGYVPDSVLGRFFWDTRETIDPVRWKSWVGAWRFAHFLALAYLGWVAAGAGGARLRTGWGVIARSADTRAKVRLVAGAALIATAPYTYIAEIKWLAPALDRWILANIPLVEGRYLGIVQLAHLAAMVPFVWHSIGDRARAWLARDAFLAIVPVIRKVGTQSLAVFMVSIVVARFNGAWMDRIDEWLAGTDWTYITGRDAWIFALVNLTGFGILIATAYIVGWFKRQPWRERAPSTQTHRQPEARPGRAGMIAAE